MRALVVGIGGRADATHQRVVDQLHKPDQSNHIEGRGGMDQE